MDKFFAFLLGLMLLLAGNMLFIYLISLCYGITFTVDGAVGIFLVFMLIRMNLCSGNDGKEK